jgi:hypothetical protein
LLPLPLRERQYARKPRQNLFVLRSLFYPPETFTDPLRFQLTKYATRVTTRILEKRKSVLPTLAYFNAVLPPPLEPSTSRSIASSRPKRRRPKPLDPLRVKLLVAPIVKAEVKAALLRGRPSVKSTIGGKRTRLSKARRAIARKRSLEVMKK